MIVEMFHSKEVGELPNDTRTFVRITLSPENTEEEDMIRNAKILHQNQLQVWWGDTVELECGGQPVLYSGLKISYRVPKD